MLFILDCIQFDFKFVVKLTYWHFTFLFTIKHMIWFWIEFWIWAWEKIIWAVFVFKRVWKAGPLFSNVFGNLNFMYVNHQNWAFWIFNYFLNVIFFGFVFYLIWEFLNLHFISFNFGLCISDFNLNFRIFIIELFQYRWKPFFFIL